MFFPLCKLFFFFLLLTRNKPFFPSQARERANFCLLHNPIFVPVLQTNFYFLQFAEQTIFFITVTFCRTVFLFFKIPLIASPHVRIIWSAPKFDGEVQARSLVVGSLVQVTQP